MICHFEYMNSQIYCLYEKGLLYLYSFYRNSNLKRCPKVLLSGLLSSQMLNVLVARPLRNLYFVQFVLIFTDKIMKKNYFEVSSQDSHNRYSSSVVNDHD